VSRQDKPLFRQVNGQQAIRMDAASIGPDSSRFTYAKLVSGLDEPMEMAILPNYDLVIAERKGAVRYFNQATRELLTIAQFNVFSGIEDGLLGVAADPDFKNNNWIYFYYGVGGDKSVSHLARFELKGRELIQSSKKVLLEVPTQRKYCCHSAGYLTFRMVCSIYRSGIIPMLRKLKDITRPTNARGMSWRTIRAQQRIAMITGVKY
jgi:cytochrome c